jgi:hypothetical protein
VKAVGVVEGDRDEDDGDDGDEFRPHLRTP